METTTVLLLTILLNTSSGPTVTALHLPGTMDECLELVTKREPHPRLKRFCIPYGEKGAEFPKHVIREISKLQVDPIAPVRTDELPRVPRG